MRKLTIILIAAAAAILFKYTHEAHGFGDQQGSCGGECVQCHKLTAEESYDILKELNPAIKVVDVKLSQVGGLWEVVVEVQGRKGIVYMDFSKNHLIQGNITSIKTKTNITGKRLYDVNKVDVAQISVEKAIVLGDKDASKKVIVFDDPD